MTHGGERAAGRRIWWCGRIWVRSLRAGQNRAAAAVALVRAGDQGRASHPPCFKKR